MCALVKAMARKLDYRSNVNPTPVFEYSKLPYLHWQFICSTEMGEQMDEKAGLRRNAAPKLSTRLTQRIRDKGER